MYKRIQNVERGAFPRPIVASYWVVEGWLLASEYPGDKREEICRQKLLAFIEAGIASFIDLTFPDEGLKPYAEAMAELSGGRVRRLSYPIVDMGVPSTEALDLILDAIDAELDAGRASCVHCYGGIGRTGTVIGAWLKRRFAAHEGRALIGVVDEDGRFAGRRRLGLAELWRMNPKSAIYRYSPQTPEQRAMVKAWPWGDAARAWPDGGPTDGTAEGTAGDTADGRLGRARGAMLGQLAGDALGSLVEFKSPAEIEAAYPGGPRELVDGGTFDTLAGQPTDDSELALLLARSLVERGAYDREDVRARYRWWFDSGPFDCGVTIREALGGRMNPASQANGALMRVSPIGVSGSRLAASVTAAWARADAALTHPHPVCLEANALFAAAVAAAVKDGARPAALYEKMLSWARDWQAPEELIEALLAAESAPPREFMRQQGWVLIAFQNAVYQLLHAAGPEDGIVDTVRRGGDTDTNAAVAGALLGAVYGEGAIPARWRNAILACRPAAGRPGVRRPRPPELWPVDALELAGRLAGNE